MKKLLELYKKYREVISYLFWGACTTAVNIVTYWLCFEVIKVPNVPSTIISWVIAVAFAYVTNRIFVFESKSKKIFAEASKFVGARILTGFFDVGIMFVTVDVLKWMPVFWKVVSNIIVIILNYVFSKRFVFTGPQKKTVGEKTKTRKAEAKTTQGKPVQVALWLLVILNTALLVLGVKWSKTAITFLEYKSYPENVATREYKELSGNEQTSQDFTMPYDILSYVSLPVNTFGRTNNSTYNLQIQSADGEVVMDQDFSVASASEDKPVEIVPKKSVAVKQGESYHLKITAKGVNGEAAAGFSSAFGVYGGEYRFWWTGLVYFLAAYVYLVLIRGIIVNRRGKKLRKDTIFRALLIFGLFFALASAFATGGVFTDEMDNMHGGIAVAKDGGVIYKDYITQHTPFAYYLCAAFAKLGAESAAQFRIMYYVVIALVLTFAYVRYGRVFGRGRITLLGIALICILPYLHTDGQLRVLSDIIQAFSIVILLLEFIAYCKEKKPDLGWVRSIVIALGIYVSVGAAFNSVYPLAAFGIGFLVVEVKYWRQTEMSLVGFVKRYFKLVIALVVPLAIVVFYFAANAALPEAIDQAYKFNVTVYPEYYTEAGYGTNLVGPFLYGIKNFVFSLYDNISAMLTNRDFSYVVLAQTAVLLSAIYVIFRQLRERRWLIAAMLLMVCCFSFSRLGLHSIAAWAVMLFAGIVLWPKNVYGKVREWQWFIIVPAALFLLAPYCDQAKSTLLYKPELVSETERLVIDNTKDGDYIGLDASAKNESLYYQYKNRKVANRLIYMLPWYMVWYEDSSIEEISKTEPNVVVYDPDLEVWGLKHFASRFTKYLEQNYDRNSNHPEIWLKKK